MLISWLLRVIYAKFLKYYITLKSFFRNKCTNQSSINFRTILITFLYFKILANIKKHGKKICFAYFWPITSQYMQV